jgi:hypothetical protein
MSTPTEQLQQLQHHIQQVQQLLQELLERQNIQSEKAQLEQRIKRLEDEWEEMRRSLAALQTERDDYLRVVRAWAEGQVTEKELERFAHDLEHLAANGSGAGLADLLEQFERQPIPPEDDDHALPSVLLRKGQVGSARPSGKCGSSRDWPEGGRGRPDHLQPAGSRAVGLGRTSHHLRLLDLEVRIGVVAPLVVYYAVREDQQLVFALAFKLLPGQQP